MSTTRLPLVIVPRRNASFLCTVGQGRLVEVGPVPVPVLAHYALSDGGWIAFVADDGRGIGRAHSDAEPGERGPLAQHLRAHLSRRPRRRLAGPALPNRQPRLLRPSSRPVRPRLPRSVAPA